MYLNERKCKLNPITYNVLNFNGRSDAEAST